MAEQKTLVNIAGLYVNKTKDGSTYMKGSLGGAQILLFMNKHKKSDKHPDYLLYVAPKNKVASANTETGAVTKKFEPAAPPASIFEEDIPF